MRKGAEDEQNKMRSTEDLAQKGSLLKYGIIVIYYI